MKRKVFSIILGATLLTACGSSNTTEPTTQANTEVSTEATTESTETTTEAPKDSGTLGDFEVTIKDATFTTDYKDKKAIIINYDFTNNSEETASALFSVRGQAFQDGVELENAIIMNDEVYDANVAQKEIKPGVKLENCQLAFVLESDSPIEFEMTELISFSNETKLVKTFEVK